MSTTVFRNSSLVFTYEEQKYEIKDLTALDFNINSRFLSKNYLLGGGWISHTPKSANRSFYITLKWRHCKTEAQRILIKSVFDIFPLYASLRLESHLISGELLISDYKITSRFNDFAEFEFSLVNKGQLSFI